jgi:hypothetical protein
MPSPIGHALGGAIAGLLLTPGWRDVATVAATACLPDIDFLWGRHAMETHSVVVAGAVGVVVWLITRRPGFAIACALAWASHVLFDWLGSDDSPPLGVMALWPLTNKFYFAEAYVFEAISRRYTEPGFWEQNIWAVIKELLILLPPTALLWWWRAPRLRK